MATTLIIENKMDIVLNAIVSAIIFKHEICLAVIFQNENYLAIIFEICPDPPVLPQHAIAQMHVFYKVFCNSGDKFH